MSMAGPGFLEGGDLEKTTENDTGSSETTSKEEPPHDREFLGSNEPREVPKRTSEQDITGLRWMLICLAILSANLLYGLDTTIAADIQAAVSDTFDNVTQLGWLGVGFTLGSTVAILPLGKAYAMFDTKWLYIGCLTMFAAGSALCGASPSMNAMITGRVWAGVGGAGMYLGTLHLVTVTCSPVRAAFYVGLIGFVYGGGCILGPIIGGLLADSAATWRWAFYLNLVIFAAMSPIYLFVLPSFPHQTERTTAQKLLAFDWLGIILTAALYVCFVLAFTFGGAIWAWNDGRVIALIILSGAFTAAFAIAQHLALFTSKDNRLFPCEFLRDPQLVIHYIAMACGGAALFVTVYYIPLFFLFVSGDSGVQAAVRLLPFICIYVAAVLTCGYALPRVGYHWAWAWYLLSGLFLVAGGAGMYAGVSAYTPPAHVYGLSVLLALGLTTSQASYGMAATLARPEKGAEVIQFLNIAQGQSQMLGLAIASAIFQSTAFDRMKAVLDGSGYSDAEIRTAIAGTRSIIFQQLSPELRARCVDVIVRSISYEWVLVIAAGCLQTVCCCFLSKSRKKFEEQ